MIGLSLKTHKKSYRPTHGVFVITNWTLNHRNHLIFKNHLFNQKGR